MSLSTKCNKLPGVEQAVVAMGTEMNKEVLTNVGLMNDQLKEAAPGDLMIVVQAAADDLCEEIYGQIQELMTKKESAGLFQEIKYRSGESAIEENLESNLVILSIPGEYVFREAKKALENNKHVMIFSDNVSIEEELKLKEMAHEKGLLVMGPDCGTAIINGKGLCFANAVRRGKIGIVGASGTGSQEVSVRIHDFGGGISHLIGTGGRDLSEEIGGIMMLDGIAALEEDERTEVIVLISKPPSPVVAQKIYNQIKTCKKPVIVCFLGGDKEEIEGTGAIYAKTTKEAALKACIKAGIKEEDINTHPLNLPLIEEVKEKLTENQKYIRGLFCGGTICSEVMMLVKEKEEAVYSNIAKEKEYKLHNPQKSFGHTLIDFGDDTFTKGRPHPMIDPSLRIKRFMEEAKDPEVGVIVLDFVLGYGSHEDPAGTMVEAIKEAKELVEKEGRHLEILAFVLGTEKDLQDFDGQVKKLMDLGVTIASSSVNTGLLSRGFIEKGGR